MGEQSDFTLQHAAGLMFAVKEDCERRVAAAEARAEQAERERDRWAKHAEAYQQNYDTQLARQRAVIKGLRGALEDSTQMLRCFIGTETDEEGAVKEQIRENRAALAAPSEGGGGMTGRSTGSPRHPGVEAPPSNHGGSAMRQSHRPAARLATRASVSERGPGMSD